MTLPADMTLEERLLQRIREGSRDMWRAARQRIGRRLLLLLLIAPACPWGILWILGARWQAFAVSTVVLFGAVLLSAGGMALLDSLRALAVSGPFLRSLGDLLLQSPAPLVGLEVAGQFSGFGSRQDLARLTQIRDLPLILFLARSVLRIDVKRLLRAAETGLGRVALIREVEREARVRAAVTIRRLRALVWLIFCLAVASSVLPGWLLR